MKNPKTTMAAIVGLIALLVAQFGIEVSTETQLALVTVLVFVIGIFAKDGGSGGSNSGLGKQITALSLIFVFSILMTACPKAEKTIRTAKEASAQMKIYGVRLVQANIDAFRAGEISREQLGELNVLTGKFTESVKIYGEALHEIEIIVANGETVSQTTINRLAALFDAHVVDAFFNILEKLRLLPGANSEAIKTIISAIRLTILAVQSAFSQVTDFQQRSEPQWA